MNVSKVYKYYVVEDESLIRKNLIKKISSLNLPLELVGEASDGLSAMQQIADLCPNLVITDIKMPLCDGLELASFIQKNHPHIQTIILSGYDDFSFAQSAIKFGVKEYLLKPIDLSNLSVTLQKVLLSFRGETDQLDNYKSDLASLNHKAVCELTAAYLQEHYSEEICFQDLADHFGFTLEYLGKIFKKEMQETPLKYLTRIRMNEAKRLLINNPELKIQKVGELVGYKEGFYFSRAFKAYTGVQPSKFKDK